MLNQTKHYRRNQKILAGLCLLILLLGNPDVASACPTCKEGLAGQHDGVSLGYYWSILLMMATPFAIFAGWAFFIWRSFRALKSSGEFPALESDLLEAGV